MTTEWDWYDLTEEQLHKYPRGNWNRILSHALEAHRQLKLDPSKSDKDVEEALHGLLRRLQGFPPTWLAIIGPDGEINTPDDLSIEAAWSVIEVQRLWDIHDGRNLGTMVVGVYLWNFNDKAWVRDLNWGIMGHEGKRGRADSDDPADRIC